MEQGWVYVLMNPSIPGLAKVGRSTRPPPERAQELSAATGVATPFLVAFQQETRDCVMAERLVHDELDRQGLRAASNREFFRGPLTDIIKTVMFVVPALDGTQSPGEAASLPDAAHLLRQGDAFLYGHGENLEDTSEAVRFYRLAATRGSLVAHERLGAVYARLHQGGRATKRRALRQLKAGAARGNYYCYIEMASLFGNEGNPRNFQKAWDLFYLRRSDSYCAEVEAADLATPDRYVHACTRYILGCMDQNLKPAHMDRLLSAGPAIMADLQALREGALGSAQLRQRTGPALRWIYENLVPAGTRPMARPVFLPAFMAGWFTSSGNAVA